MNDRQQRNPRFPKLTLKEAVCRIEKLHANHGKRPTRIEALADDLGYKALSGTLSGTARTVLASLSYYGLLEREDAKNQFVSELALRIIRPIDDNKKHEALWEANITPALFKTISTSFKGLFGTPLANSLLHDIDRFDAKGAERVAEIWEKNLAYIEGHRPNDLVEEDENGLDTGDKGEPEPDVESGPTPSDEQLTKTQKPQGPAMATAQNPITIPFGNQLAQFPQGIGQAGYKALSQALKGLEPLIVGQVDSPEPEEDLDRSAD